MYSIYCNFMMGGSQLVKEGLTKEEAQTHCRSPETSSGTCTSEEGIALTKEKGPWFHGYEEE